MNGNAELLAAGRAKPNRYAKQCQGEGPAAFRRPHQAAQPAAYYFDTPQLDAVSLILLPIAARVDPVRGFDAMKSAIKAINQAYPIVRDQQASKALAISGSATASGDSYEILAQSFDQSFALLARIDFYRCLLIAQEIERKPLAILASLSICHAALVSPAESPDKSRAEKVVR